MKIMKIIVIHTQVCSGGMGGGGVKKMRKMLLLKCEHSVCVPI
jgi:hypothetical protein